MAATSPPDIVSALEKLQSLQLGDIGVVEVAACGASAIQYLRNILFERERSGLFQVRCRAVEALARLKAYDVLIEYLEHEQVATDPVEKAGDDAVINAAALAVLTIHNERVFRLLLRLARRSDLAGVIGALGSFCRVEAIPRLIDALEEDGSRLTAENALRKMGPKALHPLIAAAQLQTPSPQDESVSSIRRRKSAIELLARIEQPPEHFLESDTVRNA